MVPFGLDQGFFTFLHFDLLGQYNEAYGCLLRMMFLNLCNKLHRITKKTNYGEIKLSCSMGVFQAQNTSLALGLIAHLAVFLAQTHNHTLMSGTPSNGRKDSANPALHIPESLSTRNAVTSPSMGNFEEASLNT